MKVFTPTLLALALVPILVSVAAAPAPVNVTPEILTLLNTVRSTVGISLQPIPAGSFMMGSPDSEAWRSSDEGPQHRVTLTHDYFLGSTEVTNKQWFDVMGKPAPEVPVLIMAPSARAPDKQQTAKLNEAYQRRAVSENLPNVAVNTLSWDDAMDFCTKLNVRFVRQLPSGWTFALPTEAQWEYACRAGTTGPFPGEPRSLAHVGETALDPVPTVGQKAANPWGLYDMHDGRWEWCADWYAPYPKDAQIDPQGPRTGGDKIQRGAKWGAPQPGWGSAGVRGIPPGRSALRRNSSPDVSAGGLRLALVYIGG